MEIENDRWELTGEVDAASLPIEIVAAARAMHTKAAIRVLLATGGDIDALTYDQREALLETIALREIREAAEAAEASA